MRAHSPLAPALVGPCGSAAVGTAAPDDLAEIMALFDASVAWLNARGITRQWGTTPFSQLPHLRRQFGGWIADGRFFCAWIDGEIMGTVAVLREAPLYTLPARPDFPPTARYVEALTTVRSPAGRGLGRDLLGWAEDFCRSEGATALWLDCWAESAELSRYYERAGYGPRGEFWIGRWRGRLFEKAFAP